jgi:glyoxylase-like metal-dependent hydrolase (beta-lactamase superfamily II)
MLEVSADVYQLSNSFVNLYLIREPDGLTLIDAGLKSSAPKLVLAAISKLGRAPQDLKRILVTHADGDHVGGLSELRAASGAKVFISPRDGAMLERGLAGRPAKGVIGAVASFVTQRLAPIVACKADEVLEDGQTIEALGGLQVIATTGHTPGHLAFFAPRDGVLFAGDAMMAMSGTLQWRDGPFTDNYVAGLQSVRKLEGLQPRVVCCGHGNPVRGDNLEFPRQ